MDYQLEQTGQQVQNILNQAPTTEENLQNEITRSTNKDNELETAIENEETRAEGAEANLQTAIENEVSRAEGVEGNLQTAIESEVSRAEGIEAGLRSDVDAIDGKIPTGASDQNKLATEGFVNSSISSNTADFKGTYNSLEELQTEVPTATANDYAFVISTDSSGNTVYNRYKYVAGEGWLFEYALNNSSFTAAQWSAINSAITSVLVAKLNGLPTAAELTQRLNAIIDSVATEKTRAEGIEAGLRTDVNTNAAAIVTEKNRAQGVEGTLQTSIVAEENRAKAAETLLQQNINAEAILRDNSDDALQAEIDEINAMIPTQASDANKLATEGFVNSSIATNTGEFKGTYNSLAELQAVTNVNANDYGFVIATDGTGNTVYNRYKYVTGQGWVFEYALNNSSFTAAQWGAINSGITAALAAKINGLPDIDALNAMFAAITSKIPANASSSNKLVDYAQLVAALAAKQDNLIFDNAPTENSNNPVKSGGVYSAIDTVTAAIVGLQSSKQDMLTFDQYPTPGSNNPVRSTGIYSSIENAVAPKANQTDLDNAVIRISTNEVDIAQLQAAYRGLTQNDVVPVAPTDTWPVANPQENIIYRVADRTHTPPQYYTDYMWNGTVMVEMAQYDNAIDPRPKKNSQNLVTSGGVFDNMGALDVSELNATENPHTLAQYADLSSALAAIPTDYQKGGMSIKFVCTYDNKYIQARCMNQNFTTDVTQWQGVDETPIPGSRNLVESGGVDKSIKQETNRAVTKESVIKHKIENFKHTNEDKFSIVDKNGNIAFEVSITGVDGLNLGNNLKSVLSKLFMSCKDTHENGVSITDKDGNVISYLPRIVVEEGCYFTDKDGNVGGYIIDGVWETIKVNDADNMSAINRINTEWKNTKALKEQLDNITYPLLSLKESQGVQKTVTIPSIGVKKNAIARIHLHYGSSAYTPLYNDVFFNGNCKTDFSDVRVKDSSGKILKARIVNAVNCDILVDDNLKKTYIRTTSFGWLVGSSSNGVYISKNNGSTWELLPNTTNVTEHPGDVYGNTSIIAIFVDSNDNIFGYAGGQLYKIAWDSVNETYGTPTIVCDFTFVNDNNETVYPEIQEHGMDEDINGNLYFGGYQGTSYYHVDVFVSTDGGNNWTLKHHYDNTSEHREQHVHLVSADKYSPRVYVCIDNGGYIKGPTTLITEDAGETWQDITFYLQKSRGHDYFPSYFGTNYKLGGGENYTLGGYASIRVTNDSVVANTILEPIIKGFAGIRRYADFGNDDLIVAATQRVAKTSENNILFSYDKGKSFVPVATWDFVPSNVSGTGFREVVTPKGTLVGDSEPCVILNQGDTPTCRIYKGGSHYFAELEVLLGDTENNDIVLTVESGYLVKYPYNILPENQEAPLYCIPLNEGIGNTIQDSEGNISVIRGKYNWETKEEVQRYGEYCNSLVPLEYASAIKIERGNKVSFGKIDKLSFNRNYTVSFWLNEKAFGVPYRLDQQYVHPNSINNVEDVRCLLKLGNYAIIRFKNYIGITPRDLQSVNSVYYVQAPGGTVLEHSDCYSLLTFVFTSSGVTIYMNGCPLYDTVSNHWQDMGYLNGNLSDYDIEIGPDSTISMSYISDIKIYDKALTADDILSIYKNYSF